MHNGPVHHVASKLWRLYQHRPDIKKNLFACRELVGKYVQLRCYVVGADVWFFKRLLKFFLCLNDLFVYKFKEFILLRYQMPSRRQQGRVVRYWRIWVDLLNLMIEVVYLSLPLLLWTVRYVMFYLHIIITCWYGYSSVLYIQPIISTSSCTVIN